MFGVIWKYTGENEIHFATLNSRELYNMRIDPLYKIIQYKPVKKA